MATIPIEIVLQDAETPVEPTPTPEEETDIAVPETGIISNGNGSNNGIGSAASIILPAIIAVLAISAMVAIIVRRYQKRKSNTEATKLSRKEKLTTAASGTIAILAATVLVGNLVIPATKAATSVEPGTAELETEDKITIIATREQDSDTITATVKDTSYATANLDFGYKVTASMAEGLDNANLYLNGDETSEYYITSVENEDEGEDEGNEDVIGNAELANNTWGYTLEEPSEGTTYLPIPLEDTPATITKGNDMVEDEAVDIYYTIKVDKDMPAGTYAGEIEYNISPAVEYMQDFATMTEEEKTATLANIPEGEQYILKDVRDEKPYYISKLADGNVWMTQNLDLELSSEKTLTPADTDVTENWTPMRGTISFTSTTVDGWQNDNYTPYSADPGSLYMYSSGAADDDEQYISSEACQEAHSDCGAHNHVGNYYNWSAAVANNNTAGITKDFTNVETSICPAGWRLPTGRDSNNTAASREWNAVLYAEGVASSPTGDGYTSDGFNKIRTAPLWLIRSGNTSSSLFRIGGMGVYWSSTVYAGSGAYNLYFDSASVIAANGSYSRYFGETVRCLAK